MTGFGGRISVNLPVTMLMFALLCSITTLVLFKLSIAIGNSGDTFAIWLWMSGVMWVSTLLWSVTVAFVVMAIVLSEKNFRKLWGTQDSVGFLILVYAQSVLNITIGLFKLSALFGVLLMLSNVAVLITTYSLARRNINP